MAETRTGILSDYLYYNEENGYAVFLIETESGYETVVGHIPRLPEGENIRIWGSLAHHSKYGQQLKMEGYEVMMPTGAHQIIAYLSSGLIEGIGPQMAARMVEAFGEDIFDVMDYTPEKLLSVSGIGEKKLAKLMESWSEQRRNRKVMMELQKLQITTLAAMKIYKTFGDLALETVRENPYQLAELIQGIGFRQADRIAEMVGVSRDSPYRLRSGIHHVLIRQAGEGHSCYPQEKLIAEAADTLGITEEELEGPLVDMILEGSIHVERTSGMNLVYLAPFFAAEAGIVRRLAALMEDRDPLPLMDRERIITEIEGRMGLELAPEQVAAIHLTLDEPIVLITGGPGTGKTTLVQFIIELLERSAHRVALAAPTGRAAKRMSQTTDREAKTLHRLLEYIPPALAGDEGGFQRDESNPLDIDVLIVDEMSMVDLMLMHSLLKAMPPGGRMILVGDADQLHSVGSGNVLRDLLESQVIPTCRLTDIFRQARESAIVLNAHRINRGEAPLVNERDKDFFFIEGKDTASVQATVIDLVSRRLPEYYSLDPFSDIQVLTPMKQSPVGVEALNEKLQSVLNPPAYDKEEKQIGTRTFREGDKVMQIKNNYTQRWIAQASGLEGEGVFNGDIGIILRISRQEQAFHVLFDSDRLAIYDFMQSDELMHAYAITVHKSQGSEFPAVVMPITGQTPILMTRNLLYTAVTRARNLVVLIGDRQWLMRMIGNNSSMIRYSGLKDRLVAMKEWHR